MPGGLVLEQRVLVLAPSGRDAEVVCELLAGQHVFGTACADGADLVDELRAGAGAAVVAEEALDAGVTVLLRRVLEAQPTWSDMPLVLLAVPGHDVGRVVEELAQQGHGHVVVLERPIRPSTLLATVRTALRARMRQYQVRDELVRRTEAERALREADRRKDELLAMLSHELRNPLAAMQNATVTAQMDEARRERALLIVRRQTERLGRLVDDLLDVARITHGKIALRHEDVLLATVVERALESVRPFADERGHTLSVSVPEEGLAVRGDPERLEQVVVNLALNAVKYTEPGGTIAVGVERDGDEAVLRVRDTGIGLSTEMLPHVFDLFAQSERTPDRTQGGLGIGLTLVRHLVELHGGSSEAHSAGLGQGSEFVVRLPALPPGALRPASATSVPAPQRRARVLLVEDNTDAADALMMLLETLGHEVVVMHDGPSALIAMRTSAPDVALVDIGLPGMDGYDLARRMRALPQGRVVMLVALTGYGRAEDRQRAMAAGFDYHLTKPVELDALQGLVARV
jgi:signal transduction histidine kinase/CheY-like chemotaxis protein